MNTLIKPEWLRIKVPSGNNHSKTIERINKKGVVYGLRGSSVPQSIGVLP
jgi:hypothetical protein